MISLENRKYNRVKTKSILVSLKNESQQVAGFLRDISEGGLKIQKLSTGRQVEIGDYECQFVLPDAGMINAVVEVLGPGDNQEKFGEMVVRMRFKTLAPESVKKIKLFIGQLESE